MHILITICNLLMCKQYKYINAYQGRNINTIQ